MSTSMPTKLPEASVYSKGLKTVSEAMTHFFPEAAGASVAAAAGASVAAAAGAWVSAGFAEPPQAARDRTITMARHSAVNFFITIHPFLCFHKNEIFAGYGADAREKDGGMSYITPLSPDIIGAFYHFHKQKSTREKDSGPYSTEFTNYSIISAALFSNWYAFSKPRELVHRVRS